jgi:hypothetical protein
MNESFDEITEELKKIINQAESSGVAAWQAGEMLHEVKSNPNYRTRYKNFDEYTTKEFNIREQTANNYIRMRFSFEKEEIGELLFSSLKVIAEIGDIELRKKVVKAFIDSESDDRFRVKVKDVIATIALLDKNKKNISIGEVRAIINQLTRKSKKEKDSKTQYGNPIQSTHIDFSGLLERQPINEMGVVALFCLIFNQMKQPFKIDHDNLEFKYIKYVQVAFPDACVMCKKINKKYENVYIELQVEFEYESFNYIHHNHHKAKKKCNLIICWVDNIDRSKSDDIKSMPPILELKEFINTGKIILK